MSDKGLSELSFMLDSRRRLAASEAMRRVHTSLLREKRLGEGMSVPSLSPAERRARMELNGAPLRYKQPEPVRNPSDPTPEWERKNNGSVSKTTVGRGDVTILKQYKSQSWMDQHGGELHPDLQNAISRFIADSEYHQRVRVANLNSSGGGGAVRLGGLGDVPDHVRDGHNRHAWLETQVRQNYLLSGVLDLLIYRSRKKQDGEIYTLEDFGRILWPYLEDKSALRYSTKTAVLAFGAELLKLYKDPKCPPVRWIDSRERFLEAGE